MSTTHTNLPKKLFVQHLQEGDEEAFRLLVGQYHHSMVRLAAVIVREIPIAEDVVQETWLAVLKAIHNFEGRSTIKTWLFSIVMNRARTYLKREQRHVFRSKISLDAQEGDPSELMILEELDTLPETTTLSNEFQYLVS